MEFSDEYKLTIPVVGWLTQEDHEFQSILCYSYIICQFLSQKEVCREGGREEEDEEKEEDESSHFHN